MCHVETKFFVQFAPLMLNASVKWYGMPWKFIKWTNNNRLYVFFFFYKRNGGKKKKSNEMTIFCWKLTVQTEKKDKFKVYYASNIIKNPSRESTKIPSAKRIRAHVLTASISIKLCCKFECITVAVSARSNSNIQTTGWDVHFILSSFIFSTSLKNK